MDNQITYIALLRGINVGGHRSLSMDKLREMFTMMGFTEVSTYIQSGNVIFDAPIQNKQSLANQIAEQIANTFGYDVPVIILSPSDMRDILNNFPFDKKEGWKRYITFLANEPNQEKVKNLEALSNEIETFNVGNSAVYIHVNKKTEKKPRFSSTFIQKQLDMPATNRNLRTVNKLLELTN